MVGRKPLDPTTRTARLLFTIPQTAVERLRVMLAAVGDKSLSALIRRYLDEGLVRDARKLERQPRSAQPRAAGRKGKRA